MKKLINLASIIGLSIVLVSCAHFTSTQTQTNYITNNIPINTLTTTCTIFTLLDAQSALRQYAATQGTNSQNLAVGGLNQSSQINSNLLNVISQGLAAYLKTQTGGITPAIPGVISTNLPILERNK